MDAVVKKTYNNVKHMDYADILRELITPQLFHEQEMTFVNSIICKKHNRLRVHTTFDAFNKSHSSECDS